MKIGINRIKIDIEIAEKKFTIGIVPIHVNYLIAKHDAEEKGETIEDEIASHTRQVEFMKECIKDLLESNGYEYDEDWLISRLDLAGMQEFVVACLAKDIKQEVKKKVETGALKK